VSDDDDLAAVRKMLAMAKTKTKIAANSVDNDYPHDATDSGVYRAPYQNNVANRVVQKDQRMLKHWCVQSGTDAAQHVRQCAGTGRCDRWCSQITKQATACTPTLLPGCGWTTPIATLKLLSDLPFLCFFPAMESTKDHHPQKETM
jgi:alkylation response protein AidB-like acyl-CoA dehydrogenase